MKLLEPDDYHSAADRAVTVVAAELQALVPGCRVEHVEQYNDLKRSASALGPEHYRDAKRKFIESVLGGQS